MDHGPARDLLLRWGGNPDNLILLTDSTRCTPRGDVWFGERGGASTGKEVGKDPHRKEHGGGAAAPPLLAAPTVNDAPTDPDEDGTSAALGPVLSPDAVSPCTAAAQLLFAWCDAKASQREMADVVAVDVYVPRRAPLAGDELRAFLRGEEEERQVREREAEKIKIAREIEIARGRLRLGDDEVAGGGSVGKGGGATLAASNIAGSASVSSRPRKKSRFDQNLFIKFSKPVHSELSAFMVLLVCPC